MKTADIPVEDIPFTRTTTPLAILFPVAAVGSMLLAFSPIIDSQTFRLPAAAGYLALLLVVYVAVLYYPPTARKDQEVRSNWVSAAAAVDAHFGTPVPHKVLWSHARHPSLPFSYVRTVDGVPRVFTLSTDEAGNLRLAQYATPTPVPTRV
jgi:hypothetical protein